MSVRQNTRSPTTRTSPARWLAAAAVVLVAAGAMAPARAAYQGDTAQRDTAQRNTAAASAASPARYCAGAGTDDTLRPILAGLVPAVNALFHTTMPPDVAMRMTVFRCSRGRVKVCGMGANLPCGKADTSRVSTGATAWCRDHPDASFVPAYATGHATIYDWRCRNGAPAIVRQRYRVDRRGFVAEYWRRLPEPAGKPVNK